MLLILFGAILALLGGFIFKSVIKNKSEKFVTLKSFAAVIICFVAVMLITFGFCGARIEEGEYLLEGTNYVVIQKQDDTKYEVFDEENNILYYFEGSQVEVLKDGKRGAYGNKIIYDCKILEGNYDQPYIEEYEVDYKMNWWSFELINRPEYILYVPEDVTE